MRKIVKQILDGKDSYFSEYIEREVNDSRWSEELPSGIDEALVQEAIEDVASDWEEELTPEELSFLVKEYMKDEVFVVEAIIESIRDNAEWAKGPMSYYGLRESDFF